jgi:serine/threonine-protein kinase RsbW
MCPGPMAEPQMSAPPADDVVRISVPAVPDQVAVLRAAAAVIATRQDFSLDDIDDLRILIDEAASVLLMSGATGQLECEIVAIDDSVSFALRGHLPDGREPHGEGFAWSILKALAHDVSSDVEDGTHVITVSRHRGPVLDITN